MTDPVQGSVWIADPETGLYLLQSCPPGHQKITEAAGVFSPLTQQCKPCTPGPLLSLTPWPRAMGCPVLK
eukprot:2074071-Rhodomonas_salina.1